MKGLGHDIIEIDRIKKAINENFLKKIFSKKEIEYCLKFKYSEIHFAGRFAAKEAIVKALGVGFGKKISFLDIEILNNKNGKPHVKLSKKINLSFKNPNILLSISHSKKIASAIAIWL